MSNVTIRSYVKQREKEIRDKLMKNLLTAAVIVGDQAKLNLTGPPPPKVDTGRLRASVSFNWKDSGLARGKVEPPAKAEDGVSQPTEELTVHIGTNVYYGKYLEEGSAHNPAYPWLFPAVESSREKIKEALKGHTFEVT